MTYTDKHALEVSKKVALFEKRYHRFIRQAYKANKDLNTEYIQYEILSCIRKKKLDLITRHPGSDRYLENLYIRISQAYYEIIRKYKKNHIEHLITELSSIKDLLLPSYSKQNYSQEELELVINFTNKFTIDQATTFIAKRVSYENLISELTETSIRKDEDVIIEEPHADDSKPNPGISASTRKESLDIVEGNLPEASCENHESLVHNEFMNAEQAAEFTGYSIHTIRKKTSLNKIPFHKLPNSSAVRYSRTELQEWMASGKTYSQTPLLENISIGIKKRNGRK